jgi:LysM repeat protein
MCGQPVDSLALKSSIFSGSWSGIFLGVVIVFGIVIGVLQPYSYASEVMPIALTTIEYTPVATSTATNIPTSTPTIIATPTQTPMPRPTLQTHVIETGENPSTVAELYGVPVEELLAINRIDDVTLIQVGQTLLIPYIPGQPTPAAIDISSLPSVDHEVSEGDTLLGIAYEYDVSVETIVLVNPHIDPDWLTVGDVLRIPLATPTPTATSTPTFTPSPTPGPPYPIPHLLSPADEAVVDSSTLLFNWTASGLLKEDEFYALQLTWADGSYSDVWVKNNSWRIKADDRVASGPITWTVTVMRQTGTTQDDQPEGVERSLPAESRSVIWE